MISKVFSGAVEGVDGLIVDVEVDIAKGLPAFSIVGLPEAAVRESKDRVKAAIQNNGYTFPNRRITVNLAPADLRKVGTGFDLPIAIGVLIASQICKSDIFAKYLFLGELSLDGSVKPVNGILPIVLFAREKGFTGVILPEGNMREGSVVDNIDIIGVANLHQVVDFLTGQKFIQPAECRVNELLFSPSKTKDDFSEVKGQEHVKRALEIAAAGGHNVLLEGAPGAGKTMLARRVPTILPDLTFAEALEVTKIYSISGKLNNDSNHGLVTARSFRAPHHTISDAGLIGGGQYPKPGEVSLAHNGVLFLDELTEFRRNVLEGLRQPLEDGEVTISRASSSMRFPARFILIAAMNPCPCGFYGDSFHECTCSAVQIQRYKNKISGPLLDRFDMYVAVSAVPFKDLSKANGGESSAQVRERVSLARKRQSERLSRGKNMYCNNQMSSRHIQKFCELDSASNSLLENAVHSLGLSARAFNRIKKIARTIADLADSEMIHKEHIAEAIQYRRRKL
jgi:magnesium chelatase family protein